MPGWKFDAKMLLYESCPVAVNTLGKFNSFRLAFSLPLQPAYSFFKGRIDENMESVGVITQVVSRAAPHDHRTAFGRYGSNEFLGRVTNTFGIRYSHSRRIQATFETPSQ